ncbi:gonadotropin-releasing hormone receptor isoform X2 [Folsomia candida]|uniref:Gonadotropin-releasing hormone II receptor n=1 Tax=Folsomia candida TaxID=158441 RepID=A0A226F5I5_FOLCA|nr:gonadotropin-releasing hormone receptor isoform X2 [Folsomia candida]OXA64610.1 Gonadotropin-releasing hormone II receptor [Folsomia candida]
MLGARISQPFSPQSASTIAMILHNRTFSPTTTPTTFSSPTSAAEILLSSGLQLAANSNDTGFSSNGNSTTQNELPLDMQFNDGHLLSVIVYSILMFISAIGNLSVLNSMIKIRMKARLNRVNLLLMHLAIADLFVTFLMMPLEIGWNITVSWKAGDFMCRFMSFFRTFGLFLSGFIVMCISFDRYFAVLRPLALPEANKRGRLMLYLAWGGSFVCSLPQSYVFHLEHHPKFTWYSQCITLGTFSTPGAELAYNFFGFTMMYGLPLVVIVFSYASILCEIFKVNALRKNGEELRRSSMEALTRAKVRTLKMTVVIVATFFLCWTPYNVMSLWYWFDRESAKMVDHRIQKGLFLFACANSCLNPLIYGLFHIRSHQRRKSEMRIRQTLLANNCRLERIDRLDFLGDDGVVGLELFQQQFQYNRNTRKLKSNEFATTNDVVGVNWHPLPSGNLPISF